MNFEEENSGGFYDNDAIDQNAWQQPAPPRPEPRPMARRRRGGRFWKTLGITVLVLLALALTCGVYYVIHHMGLTFRKTESGFSLTIGTAAEEPAQPEPENRLLPPQQMQPETTLRQDAPQTQANGDTKLELQPPQTGAPTRISEDPGALSLQEIYRKVIGSVVSISVRTVSGSGSGTGIIMSEDGYIITNHHVIENARSITVLTSQDELYDAQLVGSDETSDLAVLKVEATGLQSAEFGDSTGLQVGDSVVAIGDPLGVTLRGSMTDGIISAINRDLNVGERTMTLIQTNAALNNGNSGGPLINCYGQVIGINTMKMSTAASYYSSSSASIEGLGFAIPISVAKPLIEELIAQGYVSGRPAIGISYEVLPSRFQLYYRLPSGLYVTDVLATSDAYRKGLAPGDIITAINGVDIASAEELNTVKNQYSAGDTVTLTVYRGGQYYSVDIVLIDQATGQ